MKCIALLSGGKDSVAAIQVAQEFGWEVTAVLRMVPAEDDAWMFHTPNLDVVSGIAECLDLPLVSASARADPEDEVEDLAVALVEAKKQFGVEAVVSGAIASDYQRTRIDRICHESGMKSFAPLWHKNPEAYVRGLLASGYDMKFSRVAADGLGSDWAGATLDEERVARLLEHAGRIHVAGEGGEFETVVLDAPNFSSRIVVDAAAVEAAGGRATWHIKKWHLEAKN